MVWLERVFIVWSKESGMDGTLFLIRSMKVSMIGSITIGWRDKVGGVDVSSGKAQIFGIVRVIEVCMEKTES